MAREELPQDQETFDRVLAEEKAKGTSPRVAEGRARSAAVKAYRAKHGEPERAPRPAPAAASAAPDAAAAPGGDGDGQTAPAQVPAAAAVAGVTIPTFILVGLAVVPYVDRNPSIKPGDRKLAVTLFTMLFMFGATLTIIGCFFRGPGFNWVWPWSQGLFFEL